MSAKKAAKKTKKKPARRAGGSIPLVGILQIIPGSYDLLQMKAGTYVKVGQLAVRTTGRGRASRPGTSIGRRTERRASSFPSERNDDSQLVHIKRRGSDPSAMPAPPAAVRHYVIVANCVQT